MSQFTILDDIFETWVKVEEFKAMQEMAQASANQSNERQTTEYQDGIKAGQVGGGSTGGFQVDQRMVIGGFLGLFGLGMVAFMMR